MGSVKEEDKKMEEEETDREEWKESYAYFIEIVCKFNSCKVDQHAPSVFII